jgi:hypothetical protein
VLVATAIIAAAAAAAAAALVAPARRVIHGLLAGLVCAVAAGVGIQGVLNSVAGCFPPISFAEHPVCGLPFDWEGTWRVVRVFAGAAALPAIVAAGAVSLAVERRRAHQAAHVAAS